MIPSVNLKPLHWHPYITPVDVEQATPAQLDAMKVTPSNKKISEYVRTLVHDPESYTARTGLFNAIMYVEGGSIAPIVSWARWGLRSSTAAVIARWCMRAVMHS